MPDPQTTPNSGGTPATPPPAEAPASGGTPPPADPPKAEATKAESSTPEGARKTEMLGGEQPKGDNTPTPDFDIQVPEGWSADNQYLVDWKKHVQDMGLPVEKAKKLAQEGVNSHIAMLQAQDKQVAEDIETEHKKWVDTIKADKDLGGKNLPATKVIFGKVMTRFGTPELTKLLDDNRFADHPEVVRFVANVGKAMSESTIGGTVQSAPNSSGKDIADKLYPNTKW